MRASAGLPFSGSEPRPQRRDTGGAETTEKRTERGFADLRLDAHEAVCCAQTALTLYIVSRVVGVRGGGTGVSESTIARLRLAGILDF
jgi:hypothetical protein